MPKKNSALVKMMSLINKGREIINSQEIKQDIVMFVGMTGSGKSTLINCINGVELEHFFDTSIRIDRLRVKDTFAPLPGVDIGHTKYSCTRHPAIYNPQNKTFSYVDLPGFGDTGNPMVDKSTFGNTKLQSDKMAQDVANAFFRQAVADRSEKYKVVFVLEYNDIISKGGNLSRTIDDFCNFMGGVNSEEKEVIDGIKKSMRIVVTKVPTDPQRKEFEEGIDKLSAEISVINNKMGAADHLIDQLNGLAVNDGLTAIITATKACLLYTSPSPRD